jgi:hypothetical protein
MVGIVIVAAATAAGATTACGGPTKEDRRRIDILAADPMLHLDLRQLPPDGPVTTVIGHGEDPATTQGEARRTYTSLLSPADLVDPLLDAAELATWEIQGNRDWGERRYITASRVSDGFGQSLEIHIITTAAGATVEVIASAGSSRVEGTR